MLQKEYGIITNLLDQWIVLLQIFIFNNQVLIYLQKYRQWLYTELMAKDVECYKKCQT